ncbi:MAG: EscU/YscU/HrcU family type III secretion system export apparatus switch protein, partial [Kiritimatiellae bacterium]|nr:EscU/YscU/HrcU family type III secretion system export apparatus switch protein [Kiritimatiellia bacterium]
TSKDIVSTAILVVLFAVLGWMGGALLDDMEELLRFIGGRVADNTMDSVRQSSAMAIMVILKHTLIVVLIAAVIGIVGNVAQIGFLFTFEPIIPKLEKLSPVEGAKKIFSKKNLFEFLKNVVKVLFLGYLLYKIIWASVPELLTMCYGTIDDIFPCLRLMLKRLAVYTAFGYIVIAIVDRIFQGRNFTKEMMMTKDEVKREYKEMEGSAEVKQAQRQFRDEILNGPDPAQAVSKANVVVTNPTHLAVGIRYKAEEAPLPRICALGAGKTAKIIRETALAEGIPIMEDRALARALYAKGRVDDFIPDSLIEPVAEVL